MRPSGIRCRRGSNHASGSPAPSAAAKCRRRSGSTSCRAWPRSWCPARCSSRHSTPSRLCPRRRRRDAELRSHCLRRLSAGNCVHLSPDSAQSPVEQQSPAGDVTMRGRGHPLGTSAVAKTVGWPVACLPDGRVGWSSGECRDKSWAAPHRHCAIMPRRRARHRRSVERAPELLWEASRSDERHQGLHQVR